MLETENIFLTLGHKKILRGLNLQLDAGKIYGLLGQNGAGKSTIGYLLMGLEKYVPDKGRVIFNGKDITKLSMGERAKKGITLAWQEPARYEGISVKEFLTLGGKYAAEEAKDLLDFVGLSPEKYFFREIDDSLSGGERKRIEMASVMMIKPEVVILDEPDSGIDFQSYEKVINVINYLKREGSTVVVITHNVDIIEVFDYAYLICNGVAYREGSPLEVKRFYQKQCDRCDFTEEGSEEFAYRL